MASWMTSRFSKTNTGDQLQTKLEQEGYLKFQIDMLLIKKKGHVVAMINPVIVVYENRTTTTWLIKRYFDGAKNTIQFTSKLFEKISRKKTCVLTPQCLINT